MDPICILRSAVISAWLLPGPICCTAQWTTGPKTPCNDRVNFKVFADTTLVRRDLHDTKRKGKAYGAIHAMGWWADRTGLYPAGRLDLPENRILTTDTSFRRGSDHMLTGSFQFFYRNGRMKEEYVFNKGYILSYKHYLPDGSLAIWSDFDIDYDGCLFSCFQQICGTEGGVERSDESISTYIDRKPGSYQPSYAWKAKRHNWQLACEVWAEPVRLMQLDIPKVRDGYPERALDALLIRSGQPTMPAYVAVQLPRKECQGHQLEPSKVTMSLTHADGRSVERKPAVAVLPSSPDNVLRPRKPLLDGYYYFPLGERAGDITEAYALSPGSYRMSIHYQADANSSPVLIGTAPLDVYGN